MGLDYLRVRRLGMKGGVFPSLSIFGPGGAELVPAGALSSQLLCLLPDQEGYELLLLEQPALKLLDVLFVEHVLAGEHLVAGHDLLELELHLPDPLLVVLAQTGHLKADPGASLRDQVQLFSYLLPRATQAAQFIPEAVQGARRLRHLPAIQIIIKISSRLYLACMEGGSVVEAVGAEAGLGQIPGTATEGPVLPGPEI